VKAGRPKEKGGWALTKRKVREQNPGLTGTHFYRAVMSMYSGRGKMRKSEMEEIRVGTRVMEKDHHGDTGTVKAIFPEEGSSKMYCKVQWDNGTTADYFLEDMEPVHMLGQQHLTNKAYGERMFGEFGGEHKFPLEEKGYGLKHISEHHKGGKAVTVHTFEHPETGHIAKIKHVHDIATGEKTGSWRHFERGGGGLKEIGHGTGGEGLEAHLSRVHREALTSAQKSLVLKADWRTLDREASEPEIEPKRYLTMKEHCTNCGKTTLHKERKPDFARVCQTCGDVRGGESGEEDKSFGGIMDISKAGEGRTMEWIAALFGYAEDRPEEDMGAAAGLGKGPTGEWTRPDGWGVSMTARPTMQAFNLHGPDGALYQGIGKHELFTTLRRIHHGPWIVGQRPDMTPVGPMSAVHRSLAAIGENFGDEGIWLISKAKKGSKTVRPLSDAKKQQRALAFRQYGSALRLKKPRLAKPPGGPMRKSLRAGGPVSKSACTACHQTGAIFVLWRGPEGLQKGYRICPVCQNDGQPLEVEKGLKSAVGGMLQTAGRKVAQFGGRMMGGKTKMPTPKSSPNASAKGLTVHMYGGVKGGQHQSEKVYPKSPADMHAVAERERKGTHVIHVEGPPHLVSQFHQERTLHHQSGGAKFCPGCKYHAAVGALKGSSSPQAATGTNP